MKIRYKLYCKRCYNLLKQKYPDITKGVLIYNNYFVCSGCSFETDIGYAVPEMLYNELTKKYKQLEKAKAV